MVDPDTCVYHITLSTCVHFILCQVHASRLLQIIPEMTWEECWDSEMLDLKIELHKHWFSIYFRENPEQGKSHCPHYRRGSIFLRVCPLCPTGGSGGKGSCGEEHRPTSWGSFSPHKCSWTPNKPCKILGVGSQLFGITWHFHNRIFMNV